MHVICNPWSWHKLHRGLCSWPVCTARHQNATLACSRSRRAAMLESQPFSQMEGQSWKKWNKPQLSHQCTQKIGLLVDDPSATSWWRSQEDLTPLCLYNRGHKGENSIIYNLFTDFLFIIIALYLVIISTLSYHSWQLSSLEAAILSPYLYNCISSCRLNLL